MAKSHDDVKFLHFRAIDERGNVNPRGGITIAYNPALNTPGLFYYGASRCSEDDNFKKEYGRLLASARLRQMAFPDTGMVMGVEDDRTFAREMETFIAKSFGYRRKFSRKNRKHG